MIFPSDIPLKAAVILVETIDVDNCSHLKDLKKAKPPLGGLHHMTEPYGK